MTQFLFDPWLLGITMLAVLLLVAWAAALLPVLGGEPAGAPLSYARRAAVRRRRGPDAAGRPRPRAP
ncbi:hypothetical protein SAMN05421874_11970 [Nonomuraea maritima]|uniref:Uncharacterized protein n=1 Tax=Nonomuraea maritima TaxID=683260 RepID=A0A1G9J1S6_9ACTN|nr:hypothetical protein [Nonomuraea maritima]SDL31261.1 hypothetical protein SAMN05421874_11970 [Nonomuraea maritima]